MVVGRCMSSTRVAHSSARVMGTCMAMGQAAGTAAALRRRANDWGGDVRAVAVDRLRDVAARAGRGARGHRVMRRRDATLAHPMTSSVDRLRQRRARGLDLGGAQRRADAAGRCRPEHRRRAAERSAAQRLPQRARRMGGRRRRARAAGPLRRHGRAGAALFRLALAVARLRRSRGDEARLRDDGRGSRRRAAARTASPRTSSSRTGASRVSWSPTRAGARSSRADVFIDCSGDGDIAARAGAPWEKGGEGGAVPAGHHDVPHAGRRDAAAPRFRRAPIPNTSALGESPAIAASQQGGVRGPPA